MSQLDNGKAVVVSFNHKKTPQKNNKKKLVKVYQGHSDPSVHMKRSEGGLLDLLQDHAQGKKITQNPLDPSWDCKKVR